MRNLLISFLLFIVLASCKSAPNTLPVTPIGTTTPPHLQAVLEDIREESDSIDQDAKVIIEETKAIPDVKVAGNINSKAENIIESSDSIKKENAKLAVVIDEVKKNEDELAKLKDLINSNRLQALEKLYGYVTMFWVLGFAAIVGGAVVAFLLGNRIFGSSIMMIGIMMVGFAAASQYYMEEIAKVGGIILVISFIGGIAYLIWGIYRANTVSLAVKEIVEMMEILKETMTDDEKERIFGEKGLASRLQSEITQKVVAKIKEKNGLRKLEDIKPQS
jgi:ABC-type multidrug transport system fused ATPase/permease subunit